MVRTGNQVEQFYYGISLPILENVSSQPASQSQRPTRVHDAHAATPNQRVLEYANHGIRNIRAIPNTPGMHQVEFSWAASDVRVQDISAEALRKRGFAYDARTNQLLKRGRNCEIPVKNSPLDRIPQPVNGDFTRLPPRFSEAIKAISLHPWYDPEGTIWFKIKWKHSWIPLEHILKYQVYQFELIKFCEEKAHLLETKPQLRLVYDTFQDYLSQPDRHLFTSYVDEPEEEDEDFIDSDYEPDDDDDSDWDDE